MKDAIRPPFTASSSLACIHTPSSVQKKTKLEERTSLHRLRVLLT